MEFKIGDKIRAYHFKPCEGRAESYIEGVIDGISCERDCFIVKTTKDVIAGKEKPINDINREYQVPIPGEVIMCFDFEGRVTKI
jgi:hypothetical protein